MTKANDIIICDTLCAAEEVKATMDDGSVILSKDSSIELFDYFNAVIESQIKFKEGSKT